METNETPSIKKQSWDEKLANKVREVATPERTLEILSGQIMIGLENAHDMNLVPENYGMTREQVGSLYSLENPTAQWALDHIGDIWEISAGFTAMRLGFVAVNDVLKKEPVKKLLGGGTPGF